MVVTALAFAWAAMVATPFVGLAQRQRVRRRGRHLVTSPQPSPARAWRARPMPRPARIVFSVLTAPWRRRARRVRSDIIRRELPVAIDLLGVAVGAGCTPYAAVDVAARWCPPAVGDALSAINGDCALGASFDTALRDAARRTPPLAPLTDALGAASRLGAPMMPTLARLAGEQRADLRRAAETRARTVPVRLLFPLVFLVLPAFGLLTVVPVLIDGITRAR